MKTINLLRTYNQICKEMDIVYHNYAKGCGLSDMSYWILYSIAEADEYFTQRDFCHEWFFAPQTVNSALKDLEKREIIFLEAVPGNKKNKLIKPTEKGKKFINEFIIPIINSECESFETMSAEECTLMLSTTKKYISILKEKISKLDTENSSSK